MKMTKLAISAFLMIFTAVNSDEPSLTKEFHDILIIKTDQSNHIIDAFWYTLEWAEYPLQYDLFRSSKKGVLLSKHLNTNQLKFKRELRSEYYDIDMHESASIENLDF